MASHHQNQNKCRIFVGNIPYDATEEQVTALCKEVGHVVSFKLATDRDSGRPKGFGFCEYKDQETASSAIRNLQGCEINGRTLRVGLAYHDKPNQHHPIGLQTAVNAAFIMAASQKQPQAWGTDPLTLHLSNFSRAQLVQLVSEMKGIAQQNKDLANELLLENPQLRKALLQAHIILGMATPDVKPVISNVNCVNSGASFKSNPESEQVEISKPQISREMNPAVLQQVLNLSPDKLSLLEPEMRQQVIQIQHMYSHDHQRMLCTSG